MRDAAQISNCQKINLLIAYCFIFVLREEHLENAFAKWLHAIVICF